MSQTIGSFDAKTHFASLLDRVEQGEVFVITRRGRPVAHLAGSPHASPSEADLLDLLRAARSHTTVDPDELRSWIEDGRR